MDGFSLLRASRPYPSSRTSPRSWVSGHRLIESEDALFVYHDVSPDEVKVQYGTLLQLNRSLMVLNSSMVNQTLREGAWGVTLSEELLESIEAAINEEHTVVDHEESESSADDEVAEERQRRREQQHESARLSSIGQLPRSRRMRMANPKILDYWARF